MDRLSLHTMSTSELSKARNIQSQISQKEFEIQMIQIDMKYDYRSNGTSYLNESRMRSVQYEIQSLERERDKCINNAVEYTLDIILEELNSSINGVLSLGNIAVGSVISFISSQRIKVSVSLSTRMKLNDVSSKLLFAGFTYISVKSNIDKLSSLLKGY